MSSQRKLLPPSPQGHKFWYPSSQGTGNFVHASPQGAGYREILVLACAWACGSGVSSVWILRRALCTPGAALHRGILVLGCAWGAWDVARGLADRGLLARENALTAD